MKPVLLHGWGTHPVIFEPLMAHLPSARALPLPGYAGSPAAAGLEEMAERVAAQLEDGTLLLGWSLGGLVAAQIARTHPHKVKRLALVASTPCFVSRDDWPHGVAQEVFTQFAVSLAGDYAGTLRRFLSLQAQGSDGMRAVLAELRRRLLEQPRPPAGVLEAGLDILQRADLRAVMRELEQPVTLVHGSGDRLAPVAAARWMADHLADAKLHEIAGAGHAPFLSHPREVAAIIGDLGHG